MHIAASYVLICYQMAEEAFKKLEEQLSCSICLDNYTDPKLLRCFHVYCQRCLVPLGVRDSEQDKLCITCPICRGLTPVPDEGVAGLQSAFHLSHLLEIHNSVKTFQNPQAILAGEVTEASEVTEATTFNSLRHCSEHASEELKLYCETCRKLVCLQCGLKGGKHHDHNYSLVQKAFEEYREEIIVSLEPMEKQVTAVEKALAQLEKHCVEISGQEGAIEDRIHVTFRQLHAILTARETELVDQLHQTTQGKLKSLAAQRDQIETTLAQLSSCLHFMRESIKAGNESDVLMMKVNTAHKVRELTAPFTRGFLKPSTGADVVFLALADMAALCSSYGQVYATGSPDPSKCHASGKGLEEATVGVQSTATLQAISYCDSPCEEPIESLECELMSDITGTRTSCSIERRGENQYEISYKPTIKGKHQLYIKVKGQHIRGSPFNVTVRSPLENLGTPILTLGGVMGPSGVEINKRGEVVVTEKSGACVSVFSQCGDKILSLGSCGSGQGEFNHPRGVATDGDKILVADSSNDRIQKFTAEGQFLAAVGTKGSEYLQFSLPTDVAFNTSNNKVYVVDYKNHRLQVLNADLTFSSTFGGPGSAEGQFSYPWGVACDSTGKVYVADSDNHRIQVFTAQGKFLRMFGRHGQDKGGLSNPSCVAVDAGGVVYVSELGNHRISVFTSEGQFVTSFGSRGEGPGEFNCPLGLAVDNSGIVYVCDLCNNRIQVF